MEMSSFRYNYTVTCVSSMNDFKISNKYDYFVGSSRRETDDVRSLKVPLIQSPIYLIAKSEQRSSPLYFLSVFDTLIYFVLFLMFVLVSIYFWTNEKNKKYNESKLHFKDSVFWISIVCLLRINRLKVKTMGGKIIVAFVIGLVLLIHAGFLSSLIVFNADISLSSKYKSIVNLKSTERIGCMETLCTYLEKLDSGASFQDYLFEENTQLAQDLIDDRIDVIGVGFEALPSVKKTLFNLSDQTQLYYIFEEIYGAGELLVFYKQDNENSWRNQLFENALISIAESGVMEEYIWSNSKSFQDISIYSGQKQVPLSLANNFHPFLISFGGFAVALISYFILQRSGQIPFDYSSLKSKYIALDLYNHDMNTMLTFDKILDISLTKFTTRIKDLCTIIIKFGKTAKAYQTEVERICKGYSS